MRRWSRSRVTLCTIGLIVGVRILDAGCGHLNVHDLGDAHVTGIDILPEALALNTRADEKILGDIQTYPLAPAAFDLIYCWNTLEHVRHPRAAIENLARALAPGGDLVIGVPNLLSVKGLITKLTPHAFHVWVYRRVLGNPLAGQPGHVPFKTYLRLSLLPWRLRALGKRLGLEVIEVHSYRDESWERTIGAKRWLTIVWGIAGLPFKLLGLDPRASEIQARFHRPPVYDGRLIGG